MDKFLNYIVASIEAALFYFNAVITAFTRNKYLLVISALLLLTYNKSFSLGKNLVKYSGKAKK